MDNTIPQAQGIPRLTVLVHICYTLTGTLYPPPGAPPAGSNPGPAEKPGKPENTGTSSWVYSTTSIETMRALNNTRQGLNTYPNKLGRNASKLQKGDVFAHLTSFKQTSERNIQTKRLSKRSPTLPLSLSSELSTTGNRRR
ncbi:hypothetical protein F511_25581 [Dorcoceras hygrometricum]|uniref:Uncharacterized protein n=1 Tax=Dorcoceras hygrometricum TaxID=472368 RepID=A0A2Z7AVQ5_9LAMI|nr:hypothetical protein F511_25581 [Dorcoceras hygrometricum]